MIGHEYIRSILLFCNGAAPDGVGLLHVALTDAIAGPGSSAHALFFSDKFGELRKSACSEFLLLLWLQTLGSKVGVTE